VQGTRAGRTAVSRQSPSIRRSSP